MGFQINKKVKWVLVVFFILIISSLVYSSYLRKLHKRTMEKFKSDAVFEKKTYYGDNWFLNKISKVRVDAIFDGSSEMRVSSIEGFQDILNLETLSFIDHPKIDLSPIKNNKSIKNLIIQNTDISDISFVAGLTSLEVLSLEGTKVTDLRPLEKLSKLKVLYLNNTQVSDISVLAHLSSLEILDLSETSVKDISPLKNLRNLHSLEVQFSSIRDFEPIQEKPFYELLVDLEQIKNIKIKDKLSLCIHEGIDAEDLEQKGSGHFKYVRFWRHLHRSIPQILRGGREHLERINTGL